MKRFLFLFSLATLSLSGCSKDEIAETPEPPSEPALVKGRFLDSPVEGLIYRTATQEGTTPSSGEFQFMEGEKVSFFVGEIKIGEAIGQEILSPIDIAATPDATINSLEVKNIAAFLQTLDADKNPDNGIKISPEAVAVLPVEQIDFSKHFIQLLGELVAEINQKALMNLKVVFPEVAAAHLAETLKLDYEISGLEAGAFYNIIESWETRSRNVNWIHKYDSEGRISESTAFEKFPWIPILKYTYSDYNSEGYPQFFTGDHLYQDGSGGFILNFYFIYAQNSEVKTFSWSPPFNADPNFYLYNITSVDDQRRVIEYSIISEGTPVGKTLLEYDDLNNSLKESNFDHGMDKPKYVNELFFTEFGSLSTRKFYSGSEVTQITNNYFRENHTLEKREIIKYVDSQEESRTVDYYNENGGIYRTEKYVGDFLIELYERDEYGSKTTIYNEEDGSFYIEYRNVDKQKYKTEYYDSEGNLISTEE